MLKPLLRPAATLSAVGLVFTLGACSEPPPAERLLTLVPADSPYVIATTKPLPEPLYGHLMAISQAELTTAVDQWRKLVAEQQASAEPDPLLAQTASVFEALAAEMDGHMSATGSEALGFGRDSLGVFYGLGPFPAARVEVQDPVKVEAFIARVEQRHGSAAPRAQLDGIDYRRIPLGPDLILAVALQGRDLVLGMLPTASADTLLPQLFGLNKPARSLADSGALAELRERHGYPGYVEGYLDTRQLTQLLTGRGEGQGAAALRQLVTELPSPTPACRGLLDKFAAAVPRLAVGITDVQAKSYHVTAAYETSPLVAEQLRKLARPAPLPGMGVDDDALLSVGLDLDMPATREGIKSVMRFVASEGKGCAWVDPDAVLATIPKLDFMLGPMLAGLTGAYLQLAELQLDPQTGQPGEVRAGLLLAVTDPRGVLSMAAAMNPGLAQLELPADGSAVQVPAASLPPQVPPLYLAAGEGMLAIATGADGAARAAAMLKAARSKQPIMMSMSYELARFVGVWDTAMSLAAARMEAMGEAESAQAMREQIEGMRTSAEHFRRIQLSVAPEDAGLVLRQRVELR